VSRDQLESDINSNQASLTQSISLVLSMELGKGIAPSDFNVRFLQDSQGNFIAETNMCHKFGLSESKAYSLVKSGVLGLGELHRRFEEMSIFSAITEFNDTDVRLLDYRLATMAKLIRPEIENNRRFGRIVDIGNLPSIETGKTELDAELLLEQRQTEECEQFRLWLASTDGIDDSDLKKVTSGLKSRIARFTNNTNGKVARFLVSTAIGMIPGVNTIVPIGASILDTFVIDKLLKNKGALTFINEMYPSIFIARE
jgi:hypothetical protein